MRNLARRTTAFLIAMGVLVLLTTLGLGVLGPLRDVLRLAGIGALGRGPGVAGVLPLIFFVAYGLLLMGVGEGLYLTAVLVSWPHLDS